MPAPIGKISLDIMAISVAACAQCNRTDVKRQFEYAPLEIGKLDRGIFRVGNRIAAWYRLAGAALGLKIADLGGCSVRVADYSIAWKLELIPASDPNFQDD